MHLSDRHRSFLIIEQSFFAGLINVVTNGVIAWLLMRSLTEIPLWGETSMGVDLLATGFILPFFTCMVVSKLTRGQVQNGKLPALEASQIRPVGFHRRSSLFRAVLIGVIGVIFASGPLVVLLHLAQAAPVPLMSFIAFKAIWAGLFAMLVSPIIAWWALSAASSDLAEAE